MDPNAAYLAFRAAVGNGMFDEARELKRGLVEWIAKGGFEPAWTPRQKTKFYVFGSDLNPSKVP